MFTHPFEPIYDSNSRILILGSFPSVKSRQQGFYYGNAHNRFWALISSLLNESIPQSIEDKCALLLKHRIALWDVIHSCEISGSSDSSISSPVVNPIGGLLSKTRISHIFTNGAKAHALYIKHILRDTGIADICLPSTSPANAAYSFDRLKSRWLELADTLGNLEAAR